MRLVWENCFSSLFFDMITATHGGILSFAVWCFSSLFFDMITATALQNLRKSRFWGAVAVYFFSHCSFAFFGLLFAKKSYIIQSSKNTTLKSSKINLGPPSAQRGGFIFRSDHCNISEIHIVHIVHNLRSNQERHLDSILFVSDEVLHLFVGQVLPFV